MDSNFLAFFMRTMKGSRYVVSSTTQEMDTFQLNGHIIRLRACVNITLTHPPGRPYAWSPARLAWRRWQKHDDRARAFAQPERRNERANERASDGHEEAMR